MQSQFAILVAEDSDTDAVLLEAAIRKAGLNNPVYFVKDGYQAIDYLTGNGKYADRRDFPLPRLIISDLKMPSLNGLELLDWRQQHPEYSAIPTILLSGSGLEQDVEKAYHLGVTSYFQKPGTFEELTTLMRVLYDYWSRTELPVPGSCYELR